MHYKYFVGHRQPAFPLWKGFSYFSSSQPSSETAPITHLLADHRLLSEYASLFQLRKFLLEASEESDQITIAQHRRFVLNIPLGLKSSNLSWVRVLSPDIIRDLSIENEVLPKPGQSYLIGSGLHLPHGMLYNYSDSHYARDILRFCSDLVDADILSNEQAFLFLSQPLLIPSPSCGSFTLPTFLFLMEKLEAAAKCFFENGYLSYDDSYQGRVCSVLIERLNSFLLIDQLASEGQNLNHIMGSTTMVSDSLDIQRGLMAKVQ
jgi:hypothetical protein